VIATQLRITICCALNLAFAEWVTVFAGDEKLTTALLDRLAHHAVVLTTKGKSYRMRKRRTREEPS
jgi:DNA replication protein DnaC